MSGADDTQPHRRKHCDGHRKRVAYMEIQVRHILGKRFEASARGHHVQCDQPAGQGGDDCGMTPPELLLSALGCCAMHYAAEYLQTRNLPLTGLNIRVAGAKGGRPVRLTEIAIDVETPGLDASHRERLLKAVDLCLLHQTF